MTFHASNETVETLGERLIRAMKRAGNLKNPEVAAAAGVHATTVSRWRKDKQVPEEKELEAVVDLLKSRGIGVTVAWLRYGHGGLLDLPDEIGVYKRGEIAISRVAEGIGVSRSISTAHAIGEAIHSRGILSRRIAMWVADFVAVLRAANVPDDEIEESISLVTHPLSLTRNVNGKRVELSDEQAIEEMDALAGVVFDRQREAGRKIEDER